MATYYIDNNRGSDSNAGTSSSAPWQNLSKIAATTGATAGDSFLLADDSSWALTPATRVVPPTSWTGEQKNPVIIGKYSPSSQSTSDQRPLITCNVTTVAGDWTYNAGLNGWTYTYPTAHINRAVLIRLGGTWLANTYDMVAGAAVESIDGRFNIAVGAQGIILYAPASVNPVDYYGGVVISAQASGAITLSSGRKWVTVQDIAFTESGCGVLLYSADAVAAGFVVQRCQMRTGGSLAVANGDSPGNLRGWILNNEIIDFGAIGIQGNAISGAGIAYLEINGNRIDDGVRSWAQGGIYVQVRNTTRDRICQVLNNEVSRCRWGSQGKPQDGSGIYIETGSDGVLVAGNTIHDQYCAIQDNSGRRNTFTGNLIYNCRLGIRVSDQSANNQSDHRAYNNTIIVGDTRQVPTEFGSDQGQDYPGYWMYKTASTLNVTAKNNIIANVGSAAALATFGLPDVYATSTYDLSGNWVYGFGVDSLKASDDTTPSPAPTVTNLGTTDPTQYLTESHALRSAEYALVSPNPLATVGTYFSGARLMNGRARPGWTPVGAYQGVLPRATRT